MISYIGVLHGVFSFYRKRIYYISVLHGVFYFYRKRISYISVLHGVFSFYRKNISCFRLDFINKYIYRVFGTRIAACHHCPGLLLHPITVRGIDFVVCAVLLFKHLMPICYCVCNHR